MTISNVLVLFFAAMLAGALNSVAGGGSFVSFPALIFTGVPAINANATNTVAVWPGTVASSRAYRNELRWHRGVLVLMVVSLIGGVLGAVLLLRTPPATFVRLIPYLLLVATLLFTFGSSITARFRGHAGKTANSSWLAIAGLALFQLAVATYGGYFGGGIGILMLAALSLMGMENIHEMNALKTVLASCINGVAVLTFVLAGAVFWGQAAVMVIGAIAGGYGGASFARRLDPLLVRRFVIVVGFAMTIYFFVRGG